jgi:hypothetical protein
MLSAFPAPLNFRPAAKRNYTSHPPGCQGPPGTFRKTGTTSSAPSQTILQQTRTITKLLVQTCTQTFKRTQRTILQFHRPRDPTTTNHLSMPTFPEPPDLTQTTIFIYAIGIAIAAASFLTGIKDPSQTPKSFAFGFAALVITYLIARAANKSEY